jgi:uncharacterized protein YwgA
MGPLPQPSARDYVLAILGAEPERPVRGTLMLVKLAFIAAKEIDRRADALMEFFPFDYGPYSKVLAQTVNQLIREGLVIPSSHLSEMGGERTEYRLTAAGKAAAEEATKALGPDIAERLRKLRRGADQLGYGGILRHVYTRYPEYASASKIREEVMADRYRY